MGPENPKEKTAIWLDLELGRLVVEQNLATQEEIDHCLERMHESPREGGGGLAGALVDFGVVTSRQIERVEKSLESSRSQIPGYQILSRLGSGGMATVFKARELSQDRLVAIKVLSRRLSENPEYVERFRREGQAAARLNHPNIVQAIEVGQADGYYYFVMEYIEGRTLFDDLEEGKVFPEREALDIVLQIARALEHAHSQGFIHRDVKPKNIMRTPAGLAKLADLGLARSAADLETAQAEAGRAFGTPWYISPEQIRGQVDVDFRADLYSLGATLYHLVTGKVPFDAPTPAAVMHKHLVEPLTPPDMVNPRLSPGLGEVVEVMMAKDRDQRYDSTREMLADLEAVRALQPPLRARHKLQARSSLAAASPAGSRPAAAGAEGHLPSAEETQRVVLPEADAPFYVVLLGVALLVSVILNVVLAVLYAMR